MSTTETNIHYEKSHDIAYLQSQTCWLELHRFQVCKCSIHTRVDIYVYASIS